MNNKPLKTILIFVLSISSSLSALASVEQIQTKIDYLLQQYDPDINAGIMIQSLTTGKVLYQKNSNQLFMPASVLKLFPAVAALVFLGPDYYFQTKVLTEDTTHNHGIINGNLYFYFDGDPSLTQQDLNNLVANIAKLGIHTIQGDLYIDDSIFDQELFGPGWMWDERNLCYAAPTSAITIDRNCFPLHLTTKTQRHQPEIFTIGHYQKFISIINEIFITPPHNRECNLSLHATSDNTYRITGCMVPNSSIDLPIAMRNVRLYAQNILLEQLQAHNIQLLGTVKFKNLPTDRPLQILTAHSSKTLAELLKIMLKKSDNSVADAIYKKIGNAYFHKTATWDNSSKAIANILTPKTRIFFKKMRMVDGSGLSRYNLVSPAQLTALLRYAYTDKNINQPFVKALAIAGIDGTLKYRMPHLQKRVYAKTGNMGSISSLAGYIMTTNHDIIAFAILINSFIDSHAKYRQLQDRVCTLLANT